MISRLLLCFRPCIHNLYRKEWGGGVFTLPSNLPWPIHFPTANQEKFTGSPLPKPPCLHSNLYFQFMTLLGISLKILKQAMENFGKLPSPHFLTNQLQDWIVTQKFLLCIRSHSILPMREYCSLVLIISGQQINMLSFLGLFLKMFKPTPPLL